MVQRRPSLEPRQASPPWVATLLPKAIEVRFVFSCQRFYQRSCAMRRIVTPSQGFRADPCKNLRE